MVKLTIMACELIWLYLYLHIYLCLYVKQCLYVGTQSFLYLFNLFWATEYFLLLIFTILWANSAEDKLMISFLFLFIFFQNIGFDLSSKLSPFAWKVKNYFLGKLTKIF